MLGIWALAAMAGLTGIIRREAGIWRGKAQSGRGFAASGAVDTLCDAMAAGPRGDDEEEVASEIAALRRANAALAAKARYLDVVNFFASSLLFTQTDLDDILWDVANNAVARLGLEDCVIYLLDPPGTTLVQRAAFGPKNPKGREILAPITIPVGRGIVGWVAATGEPAVIADTREDPRYITDDQARLSELAIPIVFDDAVIGVLDSEHSQAGFFTQSHLEILTTIASMTASRIGRARLDEALMRANAALEAKVAARTRELSAAIERHERLLVNTLPRPIAQRLGQGEAEIAERFESVTVLFADLVGFTERSASVPAEAVVALLSRIFTAFDSLSDRFGGREDQDDRRRLYGRGRGADPRSMTTRRRSPRWRWRCSPAWQRSVGRWVPRWPSGSGSRADRGRRRARHPEARIRPVGRDRQHREPHGVARAARDDPGR
jgi:GAF domain-containing protein